MTLLSGEALEMRRNDAGKEEGEEAVSVTMTWEQRRGLAALVEIAENAMQSAMAMCPQDEADERIQSIVDKLDAARIALVPVPELIRTVPLPSEEWKP